MFSKRFRVVLGMAMTGLFWAPVPSRAQLPPQRPLTAAHGPGLALANVPAGQALITYQDYELEIAAQHAPLNDVLREVCRQIGAELDAPEDAIEPTTGLFGPGAPIEVLLSLLRASPYELGTSGSVGDANAIVKVVVFRKTTDSGHTGKDLTASDSTTEDVKPPEGDSKIIVDKVSVQEMVNLLGEAKANFVDNEAEQGEPQTEMVKTQSDQIFKALEALIKANATAEANASTSPSVSKKNDAASTLPAMVHRRR